MNENTENTELLEIDFEEEARKLREAIARNAAIRENYLRSLENGS